jgi:hypothetical protein
LRVGAGQLVIAVHVALLAGYCGVKSGEDPTGTCMVEGAVAPGTRVVALLASLRESSLYVAGIIRGLIILEVARDTSRVGAGQVVVPVDVALQTRRIYVETSQRPACACMVESSVAPVRGVMALLARLREVGLHVIGIGGSLEVLQMARDARGIGQVVVVVDVALRTGRSRMRTRQGEA